MNGIGWAAAVATTSIASRFNGLTSVRRNPAAVVLRMRSFGPDSASITCRTDGPNPPACSSAATSRGVPASADSARMRAPCCSRGAIGASGRPQNEMTAQSWTAQPSRAQARLIEDGAGMQVRSFAGTRAASVTPMP